MHLHVTQEFLWNDWPDTPKILVNWKKVCLPKKLGGLGIRNIRLMNEAKLSKRGWKLLYERLVMWAQIISRKCIKDRNLFGISLRRNSTVLWQSILKGLGVYVWPGMEDW
ncbi:hypothetical protein CFOL_v3_13490 [Cephalotus follicularis]|uniref:Zf-RVT domain-containing protein n=1 Tax=Cephalotus follicularis TaxID=3775 RepID=A0A1Q3BPN4_CEPFO|nr:hypothetical protein CFOL_v3_13490 [Cephalotus follicularis]